MKKNLHSRTPPVFRLSRAAMFPPPLLPAVLLLFICRTSGAQVLIEEDTIISDRTVLTSGVNLEYRVADGATLTFAGNSNDTGGSFNIEAATASLVIGPFGATGRTVFSSMSAGAGGAIRQNGSFSLTNVDFIGNRSTASGAANLGGGAIVMSSRSGTITGGAFSQNRAANRGGAILMPASASLILNNVVFTDNWAGASGGAIHNGFGTGYVEINMTRDGDRDFYAFTGNIAGNVATVTAEQVVNNTAPAPAANGAGGGFYHGGANGATLAFNIAAGVTLAIGDAAESNRNIDSIGGASGAIFTKNGAGDLVLHANNQSMGGTFTINGGRVLLGNTGADLRSTGLRVVVNDGAVLGGLGAIAATATFNSGGALQVGLDEASSAGTLTAGGALFFNNNSRLALDLFAGNQADRLAAAALNQTGTVTIDLGITTTGGNFTLATWTGGGGLNPASLRLDADGARNSATLADLALSGNSLVLQSNTTYGLSLHWTGSGDGVWRNGGANWSDGATAPGAEATHFLTGDSVTFGDAAAADRRAVRLAGSGGGVTASEMNVTAAAGAYVFTGSQGIRVTGASALAESRITGSGTSGKLIKTGAATLSFENTGDAGNLFEGGIEIGSASAAGGVIQFTDTKQLGIAAGGTISFVNSGTLRAMPGAAGTLAARIEISAGATAGFDVQGTAEPFRADSVLAGAATAGFIKTGAGTLVLGGDNLASFGGAGVVAAGRLLLDATAKLGGSLQVDGGAVFGGAGRANDVLLAHGGGLRVGMPEAPAAEVLTLRKLMLAGDAVLGFSIISGDADPAASVNSRLEADELELPAGGTGLVFDVSRLSDGNYTLAKFGAVTGDFDGLAAVATVRENGRVLSDRETGTVSVSGGTLGLHMQNAQNEVITWTGGDTAWSAGKHWESGAAPISFARGDSVVFDGAADAAHADDRNITIDATMVTVTEMRVTGDANYRFNGGGIEVDAASQTGAEFTPGGGGFIKEGAGAVVFENAANIFTDGMRVTDGAVLFSNPANTITGGIELRGGIVAFDRAAQIDTAGAAITFAGAGAGTLQAMADIPELPNTIVVEAGATGVLNTQNHRVSYSGTLMAPDESAVLAKLGTGRLTLAGDNAAFAGTARVGAGALLLNGGVLGGKISVESGAVFGGAGHASGTVGVLAGGTVHTGGIGGDGTGHLRMGSLVLNNDATLTGSGTLTVDGPIATDATVALNVVGSDRLAFSGGISGAGVFEKRGAGIFELADGAVINADSINIVEGELHLAGGPALRIARSLTLESRTDLESTGKLKAPGDATIELLPGAVLTNRGAIYVGRAAGASGFKTLAVNGAYHGGGGAVVLRIEGGGSTAADRLRLNGTVSGTTWLKLGYVSVSGTENPPPTAAELQTIVLVEGGTFADGAVFQTGDAGALIVAGDPYRWGYVKSATEHGWRTTLDPALPPLTGLDTTALLMGKASMDALSRRMSSARGVEKTNHSGGIWVNGLYRYDKIDTGLYQGARGTIKGLQAGGEWRGAGDAAGAVAGVFVDYINANMDQSAGASGADTESDGFGLYAGITAGNWYAGAVFRHSREDYKVLAPGAPEFSTTGRSRAVSAELGYLISRRENVVPFVQAVWQDHDIEDAPASFGRARISGAGSLEVRAGARTVHEFSFLENRRGFLYARAAVLYECQAKSRVRVGDHAFDSDLSGVGGLVDLGMSLQFGKHMHIGLSGAAELCEQRKGCSADLTIGYTW